MPARRPARADAWTRSAAPCGGARDSGRPASAAAVRPLGRATTDRRRSSRCWRSRPRGHDPAEPAEAVGTCAAARASDDPCHCGVQSAYAAGARVPLGELGDDAADRGPVANFAGAGPVGVQQGAGGLLGPLPGSPGARHVGTQTGLALSGRELFRPQVLPGIECGASVPECPMHADRIQVDGGRADGEQRPRGAAWGR